MVSDSLPPLPLLPLSPQLLSSPPHAATPTPSAKMRQLQSANQLTRKFPPPGIDPNAARDSMHGPLPLANLWREATHSCPAERRSARILRGWAPPYRSVRTNVADRTLNCTALRAGLRCTAGCPAAACP